MTIIPLPLPNQPLPEDWCYRCALPFAHARADNFDCWRHVQPVSPRGACAAAAFAAREVLAVPDLVRDWHPAHVEAVRALAVDLLDVVAIAEQVVQRRAS